jgi:hypothetical protein
VVLRNRKLAAFPKFVAAFVAALVVVMAPRRAFAEHGLEDDPDAVTEGAAGERDDIADVDEALGTHGNMHTHAQSVSFDANKRSLELKGDVRVDSPPFHLRSDRITLTRTRYGVEVDGNGRLAFCPCLGTPLTIEFTRAIVAPPGELVLRNPKLEIYGVPVAWLPWFWMRSDEKIGVLPPDVAFRGQDGVYLGEGVHLPWKDRGAREVLDLRGGAYLQGGFVADGSLRSPTSTTKIRYDRLPGARAPVLPGAPDANADDGLFVDARGASNHDVTTIAWDADVVRGRRGVAATTDIDAAAKPWDRASAAGAVRIEPGRDWVIAETGVRAVTRRGGALDTVDASGPFAALRSSGGVSGLTYDAAVEGGGLRTSGSAALDAPTTPDAVSYARAEGGLLATEAVGPIAAWLSARGAGTVASGGSREGTDHAAGARLHVGAPLVRAYAPEDVDPLLHVLEPFAEVSVLHARGDALLGSLPGRGLASVDGTVPIAEGGFTSTLGHWAARDAIEIGAAGGAAHDGDGVRPLARSRLSARLAWLGAQVETGHVVKTGAGRGGSAVLARVRVGRADGPRVYGNVATLYGLDPVLARALTEAVLEVPGGFYAREGTTGGTGLVIPWARPITTSVGADFDATNREFIAMRAGVDLRDKCGCLTLRSNVSHRLGREGVDVWVALDFAATQ